MGGGGVLGLVNFFLQRTKKKNKKKNVIFVFGVWGLQVKFYKESKSTHFFFFFFWGGGGGGGVEREWKG